MFYSNPDDKDVNEVWKSLRHVIDNDVLIQKKSYHLSILCEQLNTTSRFIHPENAKLYR